MILNTGKLTFSVQPCFTPLTLNLDGFLDGRDEIAIDFFERLKIDNAALRFSRHVHAVLSEQLGVFRKQLVGSIGDTALQLEHIFLTLEAESNDNLAFPQRDGAEDGGLNFVDEDFVVILDEPDLWRCLDSDGLTELEIMHFFLEAIHCVFKITHHLCAHGVAFGLCLCAQRRNGLIA